MWRTALQRFRVVPTELRPFLDANSTVVKADGSALHSRTRLAVADTNSNSIYENLAAEEALIRGLSLDKEQCLLLFYVNHPCVVVGRNQNLFQEVALRRTTADGVNVARRASGGGAVFHEERNLCFSFITHRSRYAPEKTIQLLRLGLSAAYGIDSARLTSTGRYDLFLDGKKITGSAMRVQRDIAYHHCTLLVDTPHELLGRYLYPEGDYAAFETSSVGSVRSPVTTLTEAGCVTCTGSLAMAEMQRNMTHFFLSQGERILDADAPWDLDIHDLRSAFAEAAAVHAQSPLYRLDVTAAVAEDIQFVEGYGRRAGRGDAATLGEAVQHAKSRTWAYAQPAFTSTVLVTVAEIEQRLRALAGWEDLLRLSGIPGAELMAQLELLLLEGECGNETGEEALALRTTVDHRKVTQLLVRRVTVPSPSSSSFSTGEVPEVPVEWLTRFLSTLLVDCPCDAPVDGLEVAGNTDLLAQGLLHEAGTLVPDLPDFAQGTAVVMTLRVLLEAWREKNVFDVCTQE